MAMMAKMRSLAPAFIITVGAIFVLFMVITDSNVLQSIGGSRNVIGSVNGEDITYQEFNKAVDQQLQMYKQQGQEVQEDQMDMFRDQVWNALVMDKLMKQQENKYGLKVSDKEVEDLIFGDNPPQMLTRQFTDSLGNFNKQAYLAALKDKRNAAVLATIKEQLKEQLLQLKFQNVLFSSINFNPDLLKENYKDQTISYKVEFALLEANSVQDNQVSVTDADLKEYYDNHQYRFKVKEQRDLDFVLFATAPSAADTETVAKEMDKIYQNISKDTSDFKSLVEQYSSKPYSRDTFKLSTLSGKVVGELATINAGTISKPMVSQDGYTIYKVISSTPEGESLIHAAHILINVPGDSAASYKKAMEVYEKIKSGANFEEVAKEVSIDKGSAINGGDLSWFGPNQMVKEFQAGAQATPTGQVSLPVKSQFGYHIIKVYDKTTDKKIVAEKIVTPIRSSQTTKDLALSNAKDFAFIAEKNGLEKEAKNLNYQVRKTSPFSKDQQFIPGIGPNAHLIEWSFDNKEGKVGDEPFKINGGYLVAKVSSVVKEGVEPFDKVKERIKVVVLRNKKIAFLSNKANSLKNTIGGNILGAKQVDNQLVVDTTGIFTMGAQNIPKIGRDFVLMEKIKSLKPGDVEGPIKGLRGWYFIKLVDKTPFDEKAFDAQRQQIVMQNIQQQMQAYNQEYQKALMKNAKIVDNRYKFGM